MSQQAGYRLIKQDNLDGWNDLIQTIPGAHLLQTSEWASIKTPLGWSPTAFSWDDNAGKCVAACLILKRKVRLIPGLVSAGILYAPRGPILNWDDHQLVDRVLTDLADIGKKEKAIFIKIDPDVQYACGIPGAMDDTPILAGVELQKKLKESGWRYSGDQIQFRNSVIIDLSLTDDELLNRMKQKTRYNIHLSERKGVEIRRGNLRDSSMLSKMYTETAVRNGFAVRERKYYERVWKILFNAGMLTFLIAYMKEQAIAGLVLFHFAGRAYYFYGMSTEINRECMPTYLLQWKAMKISRELGCSIYDLWGAPENFDESDTLWGVFRFKEGLGGKVIRTIGAWDYPVYPPAYRIYSNILPRILMLMRSIGHQQALKEVGQ